MKNNIYTAILVLTTGCATTGIVPTQMIPVNLRPTLETLSSLDGSKVTTTREVYDLARALRTPGAVNKERKIVYPGNNPDFGHTEVYLAADTDGDGKRDYFYAVRPGLGQTKPYREVFRLEGDDGKRTSPKCILRENAVPNFYGEVSPQTQKLVRCNDYVAPEVLDPTVSPASAIISPAPPVAAKP